MTDTMTAIAKTMAQEFVSAVEASEAAQAASAELAIVSIQRAREDYQKSLDHIENLERQAAELVQQARNEKRRGQDTFDLALAECNQQFAAMRGSKIVAPRKLKELTGRKG